METLPRSSADPAETLPEISDPGFAAAVRQYALDAARVFQAASDIIQDRHTVARCERMRDRGFALGFLAEHKIAGGGAL